MIWNFLEGLAAVWLLAEVYGKGDEFTDFILEHPLLIPVTFAAYVFYKELMVEKRRKNHYISFEKAQDRGRQKGPKKRRKPRK